MKAAIVRAIQKISDFDAQYAQHCKCVKEPLSRAEYARRRLEWEKLLREDPGIYTDMRMRELSAVLGF